MTTLEIRRLRRDLFVPFLEFLSGIETSDDKEFFSPHPFTPEYAKKICGSKGRDLYVVVVNELKIIGYGMLRGWDEGYDIPAVGIFIAKEYRSKGIGELLMNYMKLSAQLRGAPSIRIKVHQDNHSATKLYKKLGYDFSDVEGVFRIGYLQL